ncbi:MAG: hypothetical protein AAF656_08605, partial [Planctomycetota bacterium]
MKFRPSHFVGLLAALLLVAETCAQNQRAQAPRLGPAFEGTTSGISFRPPAELRRVDARPGEIARYGGAGTFVVRRVDLPGNGYPLQT